MWKSPRTQTIAVHQPRRAALMRQSEENIFFSLDCTGGYATCRKHSLRCTIACPISVCPKKAKLNSSRHHRDPPPCRMQLYFCWSRARSLDQWAENISFSLTRVPRKPPSGSETFKNSFLVFIAASRDVTGGSFLIARPKSIKKLKPLAIRQFCFWLLSVK